MRTPTTIALATTAAFAAATAAVAGDEAGSMRQRVEELRTEIARLRGDEATIGEARADEIRAIVTDVLTDAGTRGSLRGDGITSGYSNGFFLGSADGSTALKVNVLEQIRYAFSDNNSTGGGGGGVAGETWGFENKRTRLTFSGNIVDPSLTYRLAYYLGYDNSVEDFGSGQLSDAFVSKAYGNGLSMTAGQFKLPYSAEYQIDVANLQFMDYSVVDMFYSPGYGQGLMVAYDGDELRTAVAYVNALRSANMAWDDPADPAAEWAFSGRIESRLAGNWSQFDHAQSWRGDGLGMKVGAGLAWQRENETSSQETSYFTADFNAAFGGSNLSVAYFVSGVEDSGVPAVDNSNPMGFVVAGGVFVADDFEVVARYETSDFDLDAGGDQNFSTLTVGGNWYIARNGMKVSADCGYAFDPVSSIYEPYAIGNNWMLDNPTNDGQWLLRAQLSLSF